MSYSSNTSYLEYSVNQYRVSGKNSTRYSRRMEGIPSQTTRVTSHDLSVDFVHLAEAVYHCRQRTTLHIIIVYSFFYPVHCLLYMRCTWRTGDRASQSVREEGSTPKSYGGHQSCFHLLP